MSSSLSAARDVSPPGDTRRVTGGNGERSKAARRKRVRRRIWSVVPIATFLGIIALWALVVAVLDIPNYLLPSPWAVFEQIVSGWSVLWENAQTTIAEILLGFGISIVIAIPLGLLVARSLAARQIIYPPVMLVQLVPKVAVAPLFVVWLGLGFSSKLLLTVLMTFFPLLVSSISGFSILDTRLLYLTKSMGASGWQTFRYLRFPAALPVIFSGLKTSATLAATAAIVAEFVGANSGLGYVLLQATNTLDSTTVFAVLVLLTLLGVILNYLVELIEFLLTPWQRAKLT
ncbi:ABC transporter permease [Amycolatopsis sp. DSM 110486]|uniref:ABC transporter permease n=1 Tax=Amycolatopsis sp. DSM 110486 TaxID=2865832 RepID=UPI001C6A8A2B|nr:ABC transporter permease [Amycolatopsis sp. DSM 110486]QYN20482.1 ABC transporter permease [Amycolatopsis sp. DSM 110486]